MFNGAARARARSSRRISGEPMTKTAPLAQAPAGDDPDQTRRLGKVGVAWRVGGRDFLPYRITLLSKLLDRCTTRMLQSDSGLSVAEWRVLAQLVIASPASVRQLAEQNWVDRAEVSRAAASLEKRGLVERRENVKDRRSPLLFCTDDGRELARKVMPSRLAFHKALTDLLSEDQAQVFENALLTLAAHCVDELERERPRRRSRAPG
jgi:DNA-binding MarR family transcriptional regulator